MHVGLIGAGRIGVYHGSILKDTPGVTSITVADADHNRATRLAADIGIVRRHRPRPAHRHRPTQWSSPPRPTPMPT